MPKNSLSFSAILKKAGFAPAVRKRMRGIKSTSIRGRRYVTIEMGFAVEKYVHSVCGEVVLVFHRDFREEPLEPSPMLGLYRKALEAAGVVTVSDPDNVFCFYCIGVRQG